ncbi:MAG: hypothetical protein JNK82_28130 [Myxococcaceae bacterium]|nr:hypothetical protein [Myxococcaceae bacterium]
MIVGDFLLENRLPDGGFGEGARVGFARYGADGTPIEPHTNLIAKTLVLAGVPPATKYKTKRGGEVTLQALVDEAKRGFRHSPASEEYWKDVAWTLDLFSQTTPASDAPFNKVMDDALGELERATLDLKNGMATGQMVPKRKQGIYAHSCGGMHFVQAVLSWARHPEVKKRWGKRVDTQVDIVFFRLESERQQYDAALEAGGAQYKLQILTQMVKFYGHFLETTARLKSDLKWTPNESQKQSISKAKAYLDHAVRLLEADKTFTDPRMQSIKQSQPQIYLDLIGDSCHAAHGYDGWQ